MIDKSLRMKPAIQGGGPNYLGKQKMVTAPKKWLSSPDHEPAELAYITEKEKDILIDLDLYGSLNGKPNRGPAGIMSLQGDLGGYSGSGGSSSSGGDGGGEGRPHFMSYTPPTPTVTRSRIQKETQKQFEADQAARVKDILTRGGVEDRISRGAVNEIDPETGKYNAEAIQKAAKKQARERILGIGDPLTTEEITSLPLGVNISDFVPEQEKTDTRTLTQKLTQPTITKQNVTDFAKKQAINFAAQKAGLSGALSFANPLMALYGFLGGGKKDPLRSIRKQMAKFTPKTTRTKTTPFVASGGDGQRVKTVAEKVATGQGLESGAKLLGVDYLRQKEEARRRGKIIADILNKNSYQGKDLTPKQRNDLINYIEQINKFLVPTVQGA